MKVIKNKKYAGFSIAALIIAGTLLYIIPPHMASTSAADYTGDDSASGEWEWSVNVQETLSMTVTPEAASESGDVNNFLRSKVGVSVSSNNGSGFTVGMTTNTTDTNLVHASVSANTLATLADDATCEDGTCAAFPTNFWGYSIDDSTNTGTYHALVGNDKAPATVLSSEANGAKSQDVYFGAKADATKASGTYKGTVVFTVTSETKGADLPAPGGADPALPQGPNSPSVNEQPSSSPSLAESPSANTYAYTTGTRTYRSTASSVADSANAATSDGNTKKRSTAGDFVSPLGVNEKTYTTTNIQRGSIVTTILMCVAFLAAGIGIFFFILAKRRDEEEEEDEIQLV